MLLFFTQETSYLPTFNSISRKPMICMYPSPCSRAQVCFFKSLRGVCVSSSKGCAPIRVPSQGGGREGFPNMGRRVVPGKCICVVPVPVRSSRGYSGSLPSLFLSRFPIVFGVLVVPINQGFGLLFPLGFVQRVVSTGLLSVFFFVQMVGLAGAGASAASAFLFLLTGV